MAHLIPNRPASEEERAMYIIATDKRIDNEEIKIDESESDEEKWKANIFRQ